VKLKTISLFSVAWLYGARGQAAFSEWPHRILLSRVKARVANSFAVSLKKELAENRSNSVKPLNNSDWAQVSFIIVIVQCVR